MPTGSDDLMRSRSFPRPDPARTELRPFELDDSAGSDGQPRRRPQRIADRVIAMDDAALDA